MDRIVPPPQIRRPGREEIRELALAAGAEPSDEEVAALEATVARTLAAIERLDELPAPAAPVRHGPRDAGARPASDEDPYNAFIRRCHVPGAPSGPLAGLRAGVKDNIKVAGVPMTNGSRLMEGYVPDHDAVVVERLLDAGATIVGKLNMDNFSFGGTGETSAFGYTRNPRNPAHSPGGSSSGSGAAVAAGAVDFALGVDQGGSARIPAAWCGVVSVKATHGLVPTYGLTYMDHTLDFICPIAPTVRDCALVLQAISGDDPRDPQWVRGEIRVGDYLGALERGAEGLRVGIVAEALGWPESEPDVDEAALAAAARLGSLGAEVAETSIAGWRNAWAIWNGFACHSAAALIESDIEGYWRGGRCDPGFQQAFGQARRAARGFFCPSPLLKTLVVTGAYLRREYASTYYSKAQNLRVLLGQELDRALADFDVLLTPTTPMKAFRLLDAPLPDAEMAKRSPGMTQNVCVANVTGHPALTLPCAVGGGDLPIGLQLVAARWNEEALFQVAHALEAELALDLAPATGERVAP